MNSFRPASLLALGLLWPGLAAAQPAPTGPSAGLSQLSAVSRAVQANPSLHVALLRASQSRYLVRAEEALYTPVFGASAGLTHTRSPSLSGTEDVRVGTTDTVDLGASLTKSFPLGTSVSLTVGSERTLRSASNLVEVVDSAAPEEAAGPALVNRITRIGPAYSIFGRVAVTQPLLRGAGSAWGLASLRQAELTLRADELAAQETASALLADVINAYWELWYASEAVRINQASQELAMIQERQAREQVASGALAPASALPYITQVAELEEAVLSATSEVRQRQLALAQLLGRVDGTDAALAASDAPLPPTGQDPLESSVAQEALAQSYARKQLQVQLALAKDQLGLTGDPLSPRLDLDGYVQAEGLGNRSVPPAFEQFGRFEAVSAHVALTFEMPITNTRRAAQVQAATLATHVTEKQIAALDLQIRANVASAITRRRVASEKVALAARTEKVARDQAEAERARFQAGSSIAISVQEAENSLRLAQLRVQRAKVDLVLADADLAELRGQLLVRYAAALDQLPAQARFDLSKVARSPL